MYRGTRKKPVHKQNTASEQGIPAICIKIQNWGGMCRIDGNGDASKPGKKFDLAEQKLVGKIAVFFVYFKKLLASKESR